MQEYLQKIINKKPLVMVVDDNKEQAKLLGCFLKKAGLESIEVFNGQECLKKTIELYEAGKKIDCLVVDIAMPIIDGFHVTQVIKKNPLFCDLPVILVTAADIRLFRKEISDSGADLLLQKPIDPEDFVIQVKLLIKLTRYKIVHDLMGNNNFDSIEVLKQIRTVVGD